MKEIAFNFDSLRVAWRRHWRPMATVFSVVLLGGFFLFFLWPKTYHATFSLELIGGKDDRGGPSTQEGRLKELLFAPEGNVMDEYRDLVDRPDVVLDALKFAGMVDDATSPKVQDDMVYRVRHRIDIEEQGDTMTVYVNADEPTVAERLSNGLLKSLARHEEGKRNFHLRQTLEKLEEARKGAREQLETRRSLVRHFTEVDRLKKDVLRLEGEEKEDDDRVRELLRSLKGRRSTLLEQYTGEWCEVRETDAQIAFLHSFSDDRAEVSSEGIPEELRLWRARYRERRKEMDQLRCSFDVALLQAWEKAGSRYESLEFLKREIAQYDGNVTALGGDIERYRQSLRISGPRHKVIKDPVAPLNPSSPDKLEFAAWVLALAFLFPVGVLYMLEMGNPAANSVEEVRHAAGSDVLGVIPHLNGTLPRVEGFPLAFGSRGEALPPAEAFRSLKTGVLFSVPDKPCPVLLITSSDMEEGKSTTCMNLSLAFAEDRRTLVISSNMRRPTLHRPMGVSEENGLVDYLEKEDGDWRGRVHSTRFNNLFFLPHGRVAINSSVLLSRPGFAKMLEEARREYDAVLIDSPPSTLLVDAAVISVKADAVLLVYSLGETEKQTLRRAMEVLHRVDANVIGLAVNTKLARQEKQRHYYGQSES